MTWNKCAPPSERPGEASGERPKESEATAVLPTIADLLRTAQLNKTTRLALQKEVDGMAAARGLNIDLAFERDPDTGLDYYSAVVSEPGHGSYMLSFAAHDDRPWAIRGAQHRNDSLLLIVNGEAITVGQALRSLEVLWDDPSLTRELITQVLLKRQAEREAPPSEEEVDAYVERFRRSRQLYSADQFSSWLTARGLLEDDFRMEAGAQAALFVLKLRHAGNARSRFESTPTDFDRVRYTEWSFETGAEAEQARRRLVVEGTPWTDMIQAVSQAGGWAELPRLQECYRRDLPSPLREAWADRADEGAVVGPVDQGSRFHLYRSLGHRQACFDALTRQRIEELSFQEWLAPLLASAEVEWNWGRTDAQTSGRT